MLRCLIVDDVPVKREHVERVVLSVADCSITVAATVFDAARLLRRAHFDLAIIDLVLPMREGAEPSTRGGQQLLATINGLCACDHVVGLTAFEDAHLAQAQEFEAALWSLIRYDELGSSWIDLLSSKVEHIAQSRVRSRAYAVDVLVLSALTATELEAVLKLPADWKHGPVDDWPHWLGRLTTDRGEKTLVAMASHEMGMSAASAVAMRAIVQFRPRYLLMVGIAAGIEGDFGDVLVATTCWDYGAGKTAKSLEGRIVFRPAPKQIQVAPELQAKLAELAMVRPVLTDAYEAFTGPKPGHLPTIRLGPVASGAAVIENVDVLAELRAANRKVIGVEMETYGVFSAATIAPEPRPLFASMKSICDFADSWKNDRYQEYAAHTSAALMWEFVRRFV